MSTSLVDQPLYEQLQAENVADLAYYHGISLAIFSLSYSEMSLW